MWYRPRIVTIGKRTFWRFGGGLDNVFNWLVGLFFILSFLAHFRGHLSEALGTAISQTFWVVVILFVIFKIISRKNF
jgi:hypothetical protein